MTSTIPVAHFLLSLSLLASPAVAATVDLPSVGLRIADAEKVHGASGLHVVAVQENSTAFVAGFQPGDLITKVDGAPRLRSEALRAWIQKYFRTGDRLGITWRYSKDGELVRSPILSTLMVGRHSDSPWLIEIEPGQDIGVQRGNVRFHEHFTWPNRAPAYGVVEAMAAARSGFARKLDLYTADVAQLPCDAGRYRELNRMGKELVVDYYFAHGVINNEYVSILTRESDAACLARAARASERLPCGATPAGYAAKAFGDVLFALETGCLRTLSSNEQLVMAGVAQRLLKECGLPKDYTSRKRLVRFLSPSHFAGLLGRRFNNTEIGEGFLDTLESSSFYVAGYAAIDGIGCESSLAAKLADSIVTYLDWTDNGRGLGASRFVEECTIHYEGRYSHEQCECMAAIGQSIRSGIHASGFSPTVLQSIIKSNPLVGMQLISECDLREY